MVEAARGRGWAARPGGVVLGEEFLGARTKQGRSSRSAPVSWSCPPPVARAAEAQLLLLTSSGVEPKLKRLAVMLPRGLPDTAEEPELLLFRTVLPGVA